MTQWFGLLPADQEEMRLFLTGLREEVVERLTPRVRANGFAWIAAAVATGLVLGLVVPPNLQVAAGVAGTRYAVQRQMKHPGGLADRLMERWRDCLAHAPGGGQ